MRYTIAVEPTMAAPQAGERRRIADELARFNAEQTGDARVEEILAFAREPGGRVVGGAAGELYWGWLHLERFWVEAELRSTGIGSALLRAIEDEAVRRGCAWAHLDTWSFQARPFYERHGYEVFGALEGFPPPHARYFMKKKLA